MTDFEEGVEAIFVEINLRKRKWLLGCSYSPHKSKIDNHLNKIKFNFDSFSSEYENFLLTVDFDWKPIEETMIDFMELHDLKNLIRVLTCYKNPENSSCIDLFLTNKKLCFQDTNTFETGLSDFHRLVVTVMKTYFTKMRPKTIRYRS